MGNYALIIHCTYIQYLEYDSRSEEPLVHVEQAKGGVAHLAVVQADPQFLVALQDDLQVWHTFSDTTTNFFQTSHGPQDGIQAA